MQSPKKPPAPGVWLALSAVYFIWGSTYLAIRFAIETLPPFLMAGSRFVAAGLLLYGWTRMKGAPRPGLRQWKASAVVGFCLVFCSNGGVTWAEQKVPSGIAALLVATVPLWIVALQWIWKREAKPGIRMTAGLGLGLAGIAFLVLPGKTSGMGPLNPWGTLVLSLSPVTWAVGSLYSRTAPLPASPLQATSMEMVAGGLMQLAFGLFLGEAALFHPGAVSLVSLASWSYLIFFGSLLGFTSYIWVLHKATPALASTYAFVNPVIAVFLGWLLAGEALSPRVFLAASLIVAAVVLITFASRGVEKSVLEIRTRGKKPRESGFSGVK